MLKEMIFLQSAGFFGSGAMADLLSKWEEMGFFSYLLPFLLIFALVFGILTRTNMFRDNKMINGIIALVVALMALQFSFVSEFFSQVFPRLGVGLVILLVVIILIGLFAPNRTWVTYTLFIIGAIIVVVVLSNSASSMQWFSSGFLSNVNWDLVVPVLIIIVIIATVIASAVPKNPKQDVSSKFMQNLFGGKD